MERLILPGVVPSVNHQYRNHMTREGRRMRFLTPKAAYWKQGCIALAQAWRRSQKWRTAREKVVVRLWYYWPDARKRDTHNTLKLLLDALESAGIYENDSQALPQIMDYQIDRANPRVENESEVMTCPK